MSASPVKLEREKPPLRPQEARIKIEQAEVDTLQDETKRIRQPQGSRKLKLKLLKTMHRTYIAFYQIIKYSCRVKL